MDIESKYVLRGFDEIIANLSQHSSTLYKKTIECVENNYLGSGVIEYVNMDRALRKCYEDNTALLKGITTDNDSGYMSQNIESNSSADTSLDHRQIAITVPQTNIKEVFINEDTLLEKPSLFNHSEVTQNTCTEFAHLYFMSNNPNNSIVNTSVASQNTTFSGFDEEESDVSDCSGPIPIATPIIVNASDLENLNKPSQKRVPEKENDMNYVNIANNPIGNMEDIKRLNIEENDLSSIQTRMMDANDCDMSLFESFYSFVCKLYTKNETISEVPANGFINPSQLHLNQIKKQAENSPYKNSYLQLECTNNAQAGTSKNVPVSTSGSTPVKQQVQDNAAISPELFSDDDTVETVAQDKAQVQTLKDVMYTTESDYILLKKVRDSLSGVPPPPSITISLVTVSDLLEKVKENSHLFTTKEDVNNRKDDETKKSLLVNCNECDTGTNNFPHIMNLRYHGLHYNRSKISEEFEHLCIKYTERCVGAETQSTCTAFGVNSLSPSKRKVKYRKIAKSPGKRLSHLARRRITFSKDSLQSTMNTSSCSFIGSRTRQIMVDARKYELLSRRKSPKKKSPRKTPAKSPRRKGNTPRSSGKKRYASQFNPQAIEESLDALSSISSSSSKPSTTKRALFQSPPNKESNCSSLLSIFNSDSNSSCSQHSTSRTSRRALFTSPKRNSPAKMTISTLYPARRKMTPKRALFKSPDKQSPSRANEVCDKKRKRTDMDEDHPSKISKNVSSEISDLDSSNEIKSVSVSRASSSTTSTHDITQHRKKKLIWAVTEALRSQNIDWKHPQFKVYASVLARVIRHFLPNLFTNGPRPEGSTTESMLRIARQYVFAVTRDKTVDQIIREAQKNKSRIRRPSGYVGLNKVGDPVDAFQVKNKENILQDRVNIIGGMSSDNKTLNKNRRSENVERIRRVINFGDDNEVSNTGIR